MSGAIKVAKGIVAVILGAGLTYFYRTLNPKTELTILIGMGLVVTVAAFFALLSMSKSS